MSTGTRDAIILAVRVYLAHRGRSQRWLAARIGITPHSLSRRMTGKTPFTTDDIGRIADALAVPVDGLLRDPVGTITGGGPAGAGAGSTEPSAPRREK